MGVSLLEVFFGEGGDWHELELAQNECMDCELEFHVSVFHGGRSCMKCVWGRLNTINCCMCMYEYVCMLTPDSFTVESYDLCIFFGIAYTRLCLRCRIHDLFHIIGSSFFEFLF